MMELVYGVLRTRLRLDWRLELVADRRMNRLPITVANALRLGAYQVLHLTRVPHRAAVHETVELVRETVRGPRWPGFTNAVLRSLLRTAPPEPPPMSENAVRALSIRYACPPWLVERWVARLGIADAERACCAAAEPPPLTLRVNTARTTRAALLQALKDSGHMAVPTQVSPVGIQLQKCGSPSQLPGYQEGLFYVEDEAAQLIPMMLGPRSGERVLDACAAPGGKATHLTELLHGRAELVAVDWSADRVGVMHANMARLGTIGIHTLVFDWTKTAELQTGSLPPLLQQPFDRILLDAPCSGLGILRRHPEGKWQKQSAQLAEHHATQLHLLETVTRLLRPGGVIVYSTCSTEPEETLHVIDSFCERHPEFTRESVAPWLPPIALPMVTDRGDFCSLCSGTETELENLRQCNQHMDGFFAARLRRAHK